MYEFMHVCSSSSFGFSGISGVFFSLCSSGLSLSGFSSGGSSGSFSSGSLFISNSLSLGFCFSFFFGS
jgi:hypothetical protein